MRFLKDFGLSSTSSPELSLIGQNELASMDRWTLERRSRALAQTCYLGQQITLCRVLGRYKIYVPTTDVGFAAHLMLDGMWEPWLTVFMAQRIKPGMRVVDAGANHGYYTVLFADLVGAEGRVVAVEPNPVTASFLTRTVKVNGFDARVDIFEMALTAEDHQRLRFVAPVSEPKNARLVLEGEPDTVETIEVNGVRLDTLIADWPRVDFMKIDVEGAEEAMLAGAWGVVVRDRPDMLLEFNASRCADPAGLLDRLEALYGHTVMAVQHDCAAHPVSRAQVLDRSNPEDWLLSFSRG
ncbi:MAG: FkbM family methyltransferase [Caulobacteraceae bacterium]|nr:FkbM family methyltransferase [Caulobacteraceae bacterium]